MLLPLTAAVMIVGAASTPAAAAMSVAPASCSDFVHTYLQGGLPNGSTVALTLEVYAVDPPAAGGWEVPAALTLRYPPYPAVAGQLSGAASDSRILITFDQPRMQAHLTRATLDVDLLILGCVDANHLFGRAGDEMLGLGLGTPQPPDTAHE